MRYWLFQVVYAASVIGWLTAVVLMLREFFTEYRGKVYDDTNLSRNAGLPDHGEIEVAETAQFTAWKEAKMGRVKRWLRVFAACLILHLVLHNLQALFMPSFEIPFYSPPDPGASEQTPPDAMEQPR